MRSASQQLLFDLMARVALRSVEARTFPLSYVIDPRTQKALKPGTLIGVRLDPRDMKIKFDKPRVEHVGRRGLPMPRGPFIAVPTRHKNPIPD